MGSVSEQLKEQLGRLARLAGDPEGRVVSTGRLVDFLRQLDADSAALSGEVLGAFASTTPEESSGQIRVGDFVDWLYADDDRRPLATPSGSPPAVSVFWSNHQTAACVDARRAWLERELRSDHGAAVDEEAMTIKASMPAFNVNKSIDPPSSVKSLNVPVYGPNIPNAVMRIFEADDMRAVAKRLSCRLPSYTLNRVVQSKMPKVFDLVSAARGSEDIARRNGTAIEALENFAKGVQDLKPSDITDLGAWSAFVNRYARNGWAQKLHFDHLLDNFGFDTAASDVLRKQNYVYPDGEAVTLESHAFRWISKAFGAYGVEGCMTDAVNLIFAMMGIVTKDLDEAKIASYVDQFRENHLLKQDFSGLWVPSYFVMDAELDDSLAWIILERVHAARGTKLRTFIQLPADELFDGAAERLGNLDGVYVFRDPQARNQPAVMQNLGIKPAAG